MKTTVTCSQCPKQFTHPTKAKAAQALLMHVGRMHKRNILKLSQTSGILRQRANGDLVSVGTRSNLTQEEAGNLVGFIREKRNQFDTKAACFAAALTAAGATGKITNNSTAVNRYFAKAGAMAALPKRAYTRKEKQPVVREVHVNFCPNCGCNMQAVATGIAMATIT